MIMRITHSYKDITAWFFETLQDLLTQKDIVTIGLAGGSSYDAWYKDLLEQDNWKTIEASRIRWCVTDERVFCDPSERNDVHVWNSFLGPLQLILGQKMNFSRPGKEDDGKNYSEKAPNIDIGLFGIGPDGHIASLFPHHEALQSQNVGFIRVSNAPKMPPERISLSPKSVISLSHSCLFVVGESKKEALENFLSDMSVEDCPAKLLHPEILLDMTD